RVRDVLPGVRQDQGRRLEDRRVPCGDLDPPGIFAIEMWQLGTKNGGLYLVEAGIHARQLADVALLPPVLPHHARSRRPFAIVRDERAAVAQRSQVLGWIE